MFLVQSLVIYLLQRTAASRFRHRRKSSVEIDADKLHDELDQKATPLVEDANVDVVADAAGSPSSSLQVQNAAHNQQILREEWAATRVQTAFRGFLVLTSPLHHLTLFNL